MPSPTISRTSRSTSRSAIRKGLGPVQADIALKRGVWVEGKVIDKSSGRPVKAIVHYLAFRDNPHVKDYPDAVDLQRDRGLWRPRVSHGRRRPFPRRGAAGRRHPRRASLEPGYLIARPLTPKAAANVLDPANFESMQGLFQAMVPIEPRLNEVAVIPDIALTPGPPAARAPGRAGRTAGRADAQLRRGRPHVAWRRRPRRRVHLRPSPAGPARDGRHPQLRIGSWRRSSTSRGTSPIRSGSRCGRRGPSSAGWSTRTAGPGRTSGSSWSTSPDERRHVVRRAAFLPAALDRPRRPVPDRGTRPGGLPYTVAVIRKGAKDDEHRYEGNAALRHLDLEARRGARLGRRPAHRTVNAGLGRRGPRCAGFGPSEPSIRKTMASRRASVSSRRDLRPSSWAPAARLGGLHPRDGPGGWARMMPSPVAPRRRDGSDAGATDGAPRYR